MDHRTTEPAEAVIGQPGAEGAAPQRWMWSYGVGGILFGIGSTTAFGLPGMAMAIGLVLMFGGITEFILLKVQQMLRPGDR
jgi:hypothetical protein